MGKPLTLLTCQRAKFEWTPVHNTAFLTLKDAVTPAGILHYLIQQNDTQYTQKHQMMHV